jgi:hypothetical protein
MPRAGFEEGVVSMQKEINEGKAVLMLFDRGDTVAEDVPLLTAGLHLAFRSQGDFIYTKP